MKVAVNAVVGFRTDNVRTNVTFLIKKLLISKTKLATSLSRVQCLLCRGRWEVVATVAALVKV